MGAIDWITERAPLELAVTNDLVRRDFASYRHGDRLEFFRSRSDPGGPPTLLGVGIGAYLVNRHDDVEHLLQTGATNYEKTRRLTNRRGRRLSGGGILTSTGARHRRRRELLSPSFRARAAVRDAETTAARAGAWARGLTSGTTVDLTTTSFVLAERAIFQSLMSNLEGDDLDDAIAAVRVRREFLNFVYTSPIPYKEHVRNTLVLEHRHRMRRFEEIVRREIASRRARNDRIDDLLGDLIEVADVNDDFDDDDVWDEVRMVSLTGHETIADALSWTLLVLAREPEAQARVTEEARSIPTEPGARDLVELDLASAAVSESLRLFPPTWLFVRRATGPDTLPSGLTVRRGAKFYICPFLLHRNPEIFPDPETFRLERFIERPRPPRGAYIPFGLGRHVCLGEPYAKLTVQLAVASVLRHIRVVTNDSAPLEMDAGVTLRSARAPEIEIAETWSVRT